MPKERTDEIVNSFKKKYPYTPLGEDIADIPFGSKRIAIVGQKGLARPFLPEGMVLDIDTDERYSEGALFVTSSSGNSFSSVIKTSSAEGEYAGNRKIKDYLKVAPAKLIQDSEGNNYFVSHFISGANLEYALNNNQPEALIALQRLTSDLANTWAQTRRPLVQEELARDYTKMTADSSEKPSTIDRISEAAVESLFEGDESVLDKTFYINGEKIGVLRELFEEMKKAVLTPPEFMVLTHGDEIGANVLVKTENGEIDYRLVDTLLSGYYDQSWILAFQLYTRMHVFNTHYSKESRIKISQDAVNITNHRPIQTVTTQNAKELVLDFIDERTETFADLKRLATYSFSNIARSTAFLRETARHDMCAEYRLEHFIEGLRVYKEIMRLQDRTIVMRHGKDKLLATGHHNGWMSNNPLAEEGVSQAEEAAEKLKGKRIDLIISSPLDRAKQTAEIVASKVGAPIIIDGRLKDRRRYPDWEGVHYTEFTRHPLYPEWKERRNEYDFSLPNGESLREVEKRIKPLIEELSSNERYKGKRVLIVSHGDVIQPLHKIITGNLPTTGQVETGAVFVKKNNSLKPVI